MMEYSDVLPEIITGIILLGFAWAFRSWASTVNSASGKILDRLEKLSLEFHNHRIETESRVTRVETRHEGLQRQVDRISYLNGTNGKSVKPKE